MKKITVYADFDFLSTPKEIGTLGYERVRGKDHFVFEYSSYSSTLIQNSQTSMPYSPQVKTI